MKTTGGSWRQRAATGGIGALLVACSVWCVGNVKASPLERFRAWCDVKKAGCACEEGRFGGDFEGEWHWMRSPEQEKRTVIALYNRYCIRCHGVDGRGVWDIPDVPDFSNARWQATRSDAQLTRSVVEGRGAVMPTFRGTLTLEESWAMARYLLTFVPGTEVSKPDVGKSEALPLKPAK